MSAKYTPGDVIQGPLAEAPGGYSYIGVCIRIEGNEAQVVILDWADRHPTITQKFVASKATKVREVTMSKDRQEDANKIRKANDLPIRALVGKKK